MIFGKTCAEKYQAKQIKIREMANGVRRFLWLPERLHNGQVAWLQYVISYYDVMKHGDELSLISSSRNTFYPIYKNYLDYDESYKKIYPG